LLEREPFKLGQKDFILRQAESAALTEFETGQTACDRIPHEGELEGGSESVGSKQGLVKADSGMAEPGMLG
jgi:hypothetical protein